MYFKFTLNNNFCFMNKLRNLVASAWVVVSMSLSSQVASAKNEVINDVRQIVTNANVSFCIDSSWRRELYRWNNCTAPEIFPNLLIPTTEGIIRWNSEAPWFSYDRCSVVDFPAIEWPSRLYWVEWNNYWSDPRVNTPNNVILTGDFFNGTNEYVEIIMRSVEDGWIHIRDCD